MYAEHVPAISHAMRSDCEVFKRGCLFAVLSARQPVRNVPAMLDDCDRERAASVYLFGWKRQSYVYLQTEGETLWRDVCAIPLADPGAAIMRLMDVPGLGLIKAGFVAQFLGFDVACLDSRNAEREGRDYAREFRSPGRLSALAKRKHVDRYLGKVLGKASYYWDTWCAYVAPDHKLTAYEVSALHLAIMPEDYIPF
jgi:hypothetical protein